MNNELVEYPSWWKRNWKWALPTGGCLIIVIVAASFLGYGVYKVADKLSEETSVFAFIDVIQNVQKSPEINEALGKPIRFDGMEESDYDPEENRNHLELEFDIQGTKSNGVLKVIADKTPEGWTYETFTVTVEETGEIINITEKANE